MRRSIVFVPLLACLAMLAMDRRPARAETLTFAASGQFQVQAKGTTESDARIYRSVDPPLSFVVYTKTFPNPVFITTVPRRARLVEPARISHDDADPDLLRLDTSGVQQDFLTVRVEGPNLVADREGVSIAITARQPVLGDRSLAEITEILPEYRRRAARYTPEPAALETLRTLRQPAELIVFFGSWCPHCEQDVPRLVRVLQDAAGAPIEVRFHGVPQGTARDALSDEYDVTRLPTAVVRRDSKEIARLVDDAWDTPEKSLAAALTGRLPR